MPIPKQEAELLEALRRERLGDDADDAKPVLKETKEQRRARHAETRRKIEGTALAARKMYK